MRALFILGAILTGAAMVAMLAGGLDQTEGGVQAIGVAFILCGVCIVGALLSGRGR